MTTHIARRIPRHRGPAAWAEILGPGPAVPRLEGEHYADVCIVGAGFAGLSAARRLHQIDPQARVAVLEAGAIAEAASGRNSGFMIDLPHDLASEDYAGAGAEADRAITALNRKAIGFGRDAAADYGIDAAYFDPVGKVNGAAGAAGDRHNRDYAAHLAALGEPHEVLDAAAMADLTGSRHYVSGLYTPGTVMLQPAGYIRGLAEGLMRDQVAVFAQSPVLALHRKGTGWLVNTPVGKVHAGKVILSVNGQLESFGFARRRLMHVFLYASITADLGAAAPGQARWGITPSDPMGTTVRRIDTAQGGNRVVTRTCASFRPKMEVSAGEAARAARVHRRKLAERFPALADAPFEYTWAGHLCLTRNGVAVTGEVEPGLISACAQNGLGTARGTLTGIAAAEVAMRIESDITRHFAAEAEPPRLPPEPFASVGANAYLRWKEWRAGGE